MPEYAIPVLLVAAATFWSAWRDYASGNRRDATFLSVFGAGTLMAGGAAWLA